MLCLTRKKGETIILTTETERIEIHLVAVGRNNRRCKIGINAPKTVTIARGEIAADFRRVPK